MNEGMSQLVAVLVDVVREPRVNLEVTAIIILIIVVAVALVVVLLSLGRARRRS